MPRDLSTLLLEEGHDVEDVTSEGLAGRPDWVTVSGGKQAVSWNSAHLPVPPGCVPAKQTPARSRALRGGPARLRWGPARRGKPGRGWPASASRLAASPPPAASRCGLRVPRAPPPGARFRCAPRAGESPKNWKKV